MQPYIPGYIRARQTCRLKQAIQKALDILSVSTHINLMSQYRPMGEAHRFSDLCRHMIFYYAC